MSGEINVVKTAVKRKEVAWKNVLEAKDVIGKEICMEIYRKKRRKVKRCKCMGKMGTLEGIGKSIVGVKEV